MKKFIAVASILACASYAMAEFGATRGITFQADKAATFGSTTAVGQELYSNLADFTGSGYSHGTEFIYDDVILDRSTSTGTLLDDFTFSVGNFDEGPLGTPGGDLTGVSVDFEIRTADPNTGAPNILLDTFSVNLATLFAGNPLAAGFITTVTVDATGSGIDTATWDSGPFGVTWIGLSFSNATGVNDGNDAVGQALFGTPTIGSTAGVLFGADVLADSGGPFFFGGTPAANVGLELTTPEPASLSLLSLALLAIRRR